MAPIFKTLSGLPLAVYIEPSSNRAALVKSILSNGGAPTLRIDKAKVILVDAQTRKGRACARDQLASDPERVVLFVEWIDACVSAGKLLGDDLDWGSLRIQDPEILDESLYEDETNDSKAFAAHVVKADIKEEDHVDSKDYRPWPTPTSPTRLPQGELPASSGVLARTTVTPPLTKTETFDYIAGPSHSASPQPTPEPRLSTGGLLSLKSSRAPSPIIPNYGQLPIEPEYGGLFLSACEEWEGLKREAAAYVPPPKRKSQAFERHVSLDQPTTKSPRHDLSQERPTRSPDPNMSVYQPLARKKRSPLPAGSTKRGPKRRESKAREDDFSLSGLYIPPSLTQPLEPELADDSDDVFEILPPQSQPQPSTSRNPKKLFTYVDEPMQFWVQTDLPNRVTVIRLLRKHGGTMALKMEDASYIIVSKSMPQYQEFVIEAGVVDRVAVPVAWINQCVAEGRIVPTEGYAVTSEQRPIGILTEEEIVKAAMADGPPSPAPNTWVKNKEWGYKFTQLDQEYLQKTLAWTYARDPGFSLRDFFQDLAKKSPNHSLNSWTNYYYRPSTDVTRVLNIVKALKS
ncbi:unnamed protein product [Rhizoctonia solani]|uniref:BRCT domain-containing protein n=1 Tax=Rhizoctonia solani TaxID=456999 RepID=A0A8H3DF70_9AGAM|nr:unnamed protein product [Rhizoctonia solani]